LGRGFGGGGCPGRGKGSPQENLGKKRKFGAFSVKKKELL